eukprot:626691-Amphidinium_carterae.1
MRRQNVVGIESKQPQELPPSSEPTQYTFDATQSAHEQKTSSYHAKLDPEMFPDSDPEAEHA